MFILEFLRTNKKGEKFTRPGLAAGSSTKRTDDLPTELLGQADPVLFIIMDFQPHNKKHETTNK